MQSVQTMGIDLPLKALVWQDASGHTWRAGGDHCDVRSRGQFLGLTCSGIDLAHHNCRSGRHCYHESPSA
jgi:hypothetical protein